MLVFTAGTGVAPERYPLIAAKLMRPEHVGGEQVGFVAEPSDGPRRLAMMGGEFCGNACRALAAVLHLEEGAPAKGSLLCSGAESPISYEVTRHESGETGSSVEFPLPPDRFKIIGLEDGMFLVDLPGISHIILNERRYSQTTDLAWSASVLRKRYALENKDAVGVVWFTEASVPNREIFRITPVVWVKSTNSTHVESACGSGTLALALFLQRLRRENGAPENTSDHEGLISVRQPSGAIFRSGLRADTQNAVISGAVAITAKGTAFVKL